MRFSTSKTSSGKKGGVNGRRDGCANGIAKSRGGNPAAPQSRLPRFLRAPSEPKFHALPRNEQAETEAQGIAHTRDGGMPPTASLQTDALSRQVSAQVSQQAGAGRSLSQDLQAHAAGLDIDADQVRVHDDSAAGKFAASLGANAVTVGRDIFFATGRYAPHTAEGGQLLQHELSHVAQQGGEPRALQCDTHQSQPAQLGVFGVDISTLAPGGDAGMSVSLSFLPDPFGPYSTQIGLVQLANVTDVGGTTTTAGQPLDWTGAESGRNDAQTTGAGLSDPGWFVDAFYDPAIHPRSSNVAPSYQEPDVTHPAAGSYGDYGWIRSPTDVHEASLTDGPSTSMPDVDMDFQTFARGTDNQVTYGGLEWGFEIRGGAVTSDYAHPATTSRPDFGEAMDRFQGYFSHEDVVIYFDTDASAISPAEAGKLGDARDYMDRYPDARIELTGFADQRGDNGHNLDLSLRRADAVETLLLAQGIDAGRLDLSLGMGETTEFAPGSPAAAAGSLQANRRVVVRFVRTATAPINAP